MQLFGDDLYLVQNRKSLDDDKLHTIMYLYQPLLSHVALCLYFSLLAKANMVDTYGKHHNLCESMQCSIDEILKARIELETYELLKTYQKKLKSSNLYLYVLQEPKKKNAFLKHEIYGRKLYGMVSASYIETIRKEEIISDDFIDVSVTPKFTFDNWTQTNENQFQELQALLPKENNDEFDIYTYLRRNDPTQLIIPLSDTKVLDFMNSCIKIYKVDEKEILRFIRKTYDTKTKHFDDELFTNMCRKVSGLLDDISSSNDPKLYAMKLLGLNYSKDVEIIVQNIVQKYSSLLSNDQINDGIKITIEKTESHTLVENYLIVVLENKIKEIEKANKKRKGNKTATYKREEYVPEYTMDGVPQIDLNEDDITKLKQMLKKGGK